MKTQCYISVDIGGSKLATGLVTATGEIYAVENMFGKVMNQSRFAQDYKEHTYID